MLSAAISDQSANNGEDDTIDTASTSTVLSERSRLDTVDQVYL